MTQARNLLDGIMTFILILPLILIAVLVLEKLWHKSRIGRIPLRVSVNGTRGKSSVTEYIVAGLSAAGKRPLGKITGTEPLLLMPGGERQSIKRRGNPRIQEQMKVVYLAAKEGVDTLVAECMAVTPEYQKIDARIICPQVYVITNILDDHREQYGGNLELYAEAICAAIPSNATVVTCEQTHLPQIRQVSKEHNSQVIVPQIMDNTDLHPDIYRANLEMALEVCVLAGVDRNVAKEGILVSVKTSNKPAGKRMKHGVRLINGLAVNDTSSAEKFLQRRQAEHEHSIILLHTRNDRPLRTIQFSEWIASLSDIDKILLSGSHTFVARRKLQKMGVKGEKIIEFDPFLPSILDGFFIKDATIYGFGNTGDGGVAMWNNLERVFETQQA
ncbi:MAG: poly-gamma-glutamate synthase PgsB [Candidatus Marinimicrobia bacterium]|nr:poly-gamma-glutamate synthase PgsB [Candidatus Neomarinimicrobiota bacterium]MBT4419964.1 poly-gamma-glutamate synthase PgsB [Candidatus Neomarinimicrobiota bacterium]MBT6759076.1 poly-gamma-glutamate synthase PgsB [Candidatus Neomarinimicrobiota bacterium]